MKKIGIFMAEGCEEIEGLTVVDVMRRADLAIDTISITGAKEVTGSHRITFLTDKLAEEVDYSDYDGIVLPGGMPGTIHLGESDIVKHVIRQFAEEGKLVAAICAAPGVLGMNGILNGRKAACHPGHENQLEGAECREESVVTDGNIITSRGMGTSVEFGIEIVKYLDAEADLEHLLKGLVYQYKNC